MTDLHLSDVPLEIPEQCDIHPTAIVERGAEIGKGVVIGPFCHVGPKVALHDGARLMSHSVISGRTTVGSKTVIHPFATIGVIPQDLKYDGEDAELAIGAGNSIRQYVNISIGSEGGGGRTSVGNGNLFMVYVHIGHDSQIGNGCIFVNGVSLGGHVGVEDHAMIGGHAAVHQFCQIGSRSMIAGGSMVVQDVPPFCMVQGDRAAANGLNLVGLRRAKIQGEDLAGIKMMYRLLYKENLTLEDCIKQIEEDVQISDYRDSFLNFLKKSERGVCR